MPRYLWFHAFSRDNLADTLDVLRHGPKYNPVATVQTRLNEQELGIAPPCVYVYLGRTFESFGTSAISLPADQVLGTMSPFDSGGLVAHIAPLNTWQTQPRRDYLARYSWSTDELTDLLDVYPTDDPGRVAAYLDGARPTQSGPHELWPDGHPPVIATIWADNDDCRAWLWETRVPTQLAINDNLVRWSCSSIVYGEILRYTETLQDADEAARIETLLERFVVGGVSALVQELRSYQEAAA